MRRRVRLSKFLLASFTFLQLAQYQNTLVPIADVGEVGFTLASSLPAGGGEALVGLGAGLGGFRIFRDYNNRRRDSSHNFLSGCL